MKSRSKDDRRARPALGTLVEIHLAAASAPGTFEAGFSAVERVHRLMSRQDRESDVARLGRTAPGALVSIDAWTWEVLHRAKEVHDATGGLFDCVASSSCEASLDDLEMHDGNRVLVRRPLELTLDGIAKGFAVDRAVEALRSAGAKGGAVNAGGDLRIFGDEPQPIHVRHPAVPGRFLRIGMLSGAAVATSGHYFSNSSLIDPRTRLARRTAWSATVIAADCMTADALTKPCLLDRARAQQFAAACGARALLISPRHPLH